MNVASVIAERVSEALMPAVTDALSDVETSVDISEVEFDADDGTMTINVVLTLSFADLPLDPDALAELLSDEE